MKRLSDLLDSACSTIWKDKDGQLSYYNTVRTIMDECGDPRLRELDSRYLDKVVRYLKTVHSKNSTINRKLTCLGSVVNLGRMSGAVGHVVIPTLPEDPVERRSLTDDELGRIDFWYRQKGGYEAAAYATLRETGARAWGELSRIRLIDCNWAKREIRLWNRKGTGSYRTRYLPMTQICFNALTWAAHETWDEEYLFPTNFKSKWETSWRKMRVDTGLHDHSIVPYSLRHTYAMRLLDSGVSIQVVATMLGHANINTTMQYVTVTSSDKDGVLEALE